MAKEVELAIAALILALTGLIVQLIRKYGEPKDTPTYPPDDEEDDDSNTGGF